MGCWARRSVSREADLFMEDMVAACRRVGAYRDRVDWDDPALTPMALDAVLHNLLVLGEAAKRVNAGPGACAGDRVAEDGRAPRRACPWLLPHRPLDHPRRRLQ